MKRSKPTIYKGDEDITSSPERWSEENPYEFRGHDNNSRSNRGDAEAQSSSFCFGGAIETAPCLKRELNQMPMAEREHVGHDVFGISASVADLDDETIQEFWNAVHATKEKPALDMAMELNPEFVQNLKLVKSFLYSVEGKPKQAAKRYVRHFATKLRLFGQDKLVKAIELSDFDEDDMEAMMSGGFQLLPAQDLSGRNVLFGRYTSMKYKTADNMLRALWYIWTAMVEEESQQRSGVVAIGYENGRLPLERYNGTRASPEASTSPSSPSSSSSDSPMFRTSYFEDHAAFQMESADGGFDRDLARGILSLVLSLPIRPVGYHICADSVQWQGIADMVMITICKFVRLRFKFHLGTQQECKYALMTHGIAADALPVTPEGDMVLDNHLNWIESRRKIEEERRNALASGEYPH